MRLRCRRDSGITTESEVAIYKTAPHKGVFSATCPDRHLNADFEAGFVDGTTLGGAALRACTPAISG